MASDDSMSVLSSDQKTVTADWQAFLADSALGCPISPVPNPTGSSTDFECTAGTFFDLKFSTAANSRFQVIGPYINSQKDIVLLSLEPTATLTTPLSKILRAFFGSPSIDNGGIISTVIDNITDAATGEAQLQLDTDETRNAVWCIPGETMVFAAALIFTFADDQGKLAAVKQTISQEFGISLTTLQPLQFYFQRTSFAVKMSVFPAGVATDEFGDPLPAPSGQPSTTVAETETTGYSVSHTFAFTVKVTIDDLDFWLRLDTGGVTTTITQTPPKPGTVSTSFWDRLADFGGTGGPPNSSTSKPSGPDLSTSIDLLSITAGKYFGGPFWWKIQSVLEWDSASSSGSNQVLIGLSYDSRYGAFSGRLLTKSFFQLDQSLPFYEPGNDALPPSFVADQTAFAKLPDGLKLANIFPEAGSLPKAIPDTIAAAEVTYTSSSTGSELYFAATMVRSDDDSQDHVPAPFTWDSLSLMASKITATASSNSAPAASSASGSGSGSGSSSVFACRVRAVFALHPAPKDMSKYTTASMGLELFYTSSSWSVSGYIENLQCGLLFGFLDADDDVRNAVADVIGNLTIESLDVLYTYNGKLASSFLLSGTVTLGKLEMRLFYQYVSSAATANATAADKGRKDGDPQTLPLPTKDPVWAFECRLGAADGTSTNLGEIVDSIIPNGSSNIPDFAKGITIAPAAGDESAISIRVAKQPLSLSTPSTSTTSGSAGSGASVSNAPTTKQDTTMAAVFVLDINILGVKFSFIQISSNGTTRYLLRLAVDKIPLIGSIPLINQLPQPFDEMLYLWASGSADLTEADVTAINAAMDPSDALLFKANTQADPTSTAIVHGHHFMIIEGGQVTLDHVFAPSPDETTDPPGGAHNAGGVGGGVGGGVTNDQPAPDNEPTKGALNKTIGPLSFSAVTLQYKDKVLWVHMDAILALGPISLGLLGFGIGFDTTGLKLNNLKDIVTDIVGGASRLRWELQGLALAFERPPLELAGMFEHDILTIAGGTEDVYKGGVGVSFPPYTFIGVGEYANVTSNGSSYKSVFVFAKLDGPLVTLEFATISGVRLGFGFNSVVRSPALTDITTFPFIQNSGSSGAGDDPMKIMQAMDPGWVTPKLDSYWFAAGMTITAFDVVAITAIAMFAFRDSGVVISIVADAIATMPPNEDDPSKVVLYVEIGMIAELNFVDGYFLVEASLAPTSFLLVPQCHLTGGFALAYWFGDNPNAGDWVFSIGGYHRAYTPQPYYPVPSRIGINFQIGDNIQMTGQSYFAVTPKVVMAGALIHVSLSVGPVSAYLDATFDALINFHPLHYIVEFSISVGVECDIDIWFIHIHISVHIGADLHIEGPSFRGVAHVDFWFFGFDVHFGDDDGRPPAQTLLQFWETTHQPGPNTLDRGDNDPKPLLAALTWNPRADLSTSVGVLQSPLTTGAAFKFVLQDGNMPQPMKPTGTASVASYGAGGTTPAVGTQTPNVPSTGAGGTTPAVGTQAPNVPSTGAGGTTSAVGTQTPNVPSTGAGAKWFVKGGTFQFGITTEFALSVATVAGTTDPDRQPINLPVAGAPAETVYSRPMQVISPITSALTITIKHVVGTNKEVIGGWLDVDFIKKRVPTALWSSYDPSLDLLRLDPSGPPPADLLNGTSSTVMRALGVTLSSPKPILAEAKVPVFNATAAAEFQVQQKVGDTLEDWFIPPFEPEQQRLLAANLTDAEVELDANSRWDAMIATWKALDSKQKIVNDPVNGVLMVAATEVFGWNVNRPQSETASTTSPSSGSPAGSGPAPASSIVPASSTISASSTVPASGGTVPASSSTPASSTTLAGGTVAPTPTPAPTAPAREVWQLTGKLPMNLVDGLKDRYLALPRVCIF